MAYLCLVTRVVFTLIALALPLCSALSKRLASPTVTPVIHEGVRYVAPTDDGRRGYIEAWDIDANKRLWELTVFNNRIDPKLEEDVQWVFIKSLSLRDGMLMVTSERGKTYQVDLKTKTVTQFDAAQSAAPDAAAQRHEIPQAVARAITNSSLAKNYELSFRTNPFYLRGDFNGDGNIDVAFLVQHRSTGKIGIAIVHGATGKVRILGAGTAIGNGGDDFEWMDTWQVYSKARTAKEHGKREVARLRGDALLVGKTEAGSALIYWNGKRYVWSQQGD